LDLDELLKIDQKRVNLLQEIEDLKAEKNKLNDEIKSAKNDVDKKEIIKKIHEYPHLFTGMEELIYKCYLDCKTLDEAYQNQKH
jgi:seryl-tRNA synthetase